MANPQLENGFTSIANEIAEKLARIQLSGYESRYLWVLWRCTYGWHKKEDRISNSQFVEKTGLKKQHIWRTESNLIKRNIVTKDGYKISFNKNYSQWRELLKLPKKVTVTISGTEVTKNASKVTKNGAHKRNPTKETIQKKYSAEGAEVIKALEVVDPKNKTYYGNTTQRSAADFLVSEYSLEKVLRVIALLPKTNGMDYCPNITSPYDLKEKWGKLAAALQRVKNNQPIML